MNSQPRLGPVIMGSLLTRDLAACEAAYMEYMHAIVRRRGVVSETQAGFWGAPHLAGNSYVLLENALGAPFLRIVEDQKCALVDALATTGWMALEIVVADVDALAASLNGSPFEVLRPVADLSLSEQIRAVQVRGPAGEILYLTQIKAPVPPFDLPVAKCAVERVFIPVLCTHDRENALGFYQQLSGNTGLSFDTKITVINQAYGLDMDTEHPVATLQLRDSSLIEIDQVPAANVAKEHPASGIWMVSFAIDQLPDGHGPFKECPSGQQRSYLATGPAGEAIELVETIR